MFVISRHSSRAGHPYRAVVASKGIRAAGLTLCGLVAIALLMQRAIALEQQFELNAVAYPLELELLLPSADLSGRAVVTRYTVRDSQLTLPSLWWAEQQYGGKLLENWIAYTGEDGAPRRVDLVVDRQLWLLNSYIERYQFIHRFGIAALQFGYSTRVFNAQGILLGAYLCNRQSTDAQNDGSSQPEAPAMADPAPPRSLSQFDCRVYLDSPGIETPQRPFGL